MCNLRANNETAKTIVKKGYVKQNSYVTRTHIIPDLYFTPGMLRYSKIKI